MKKLMLSLAAAMALGVAWGADKAQPTFRMMSWTTCSEKNNSSCGNAAARGR